MRGEERRREERRPGVGEHRERQAVDEDRVDPVQQQIEHVVAGRVLAATEDRIVEHQGQRGERPVDAVHEARCGVVLGEDLPDVVRARLVNARVPVDAEGVVQREARLEGVGVHQGSEGAEGEEGKEMGAPAERRPEPGRRRARRLRRRWNRAPRAASTLLAHRGRFAGASTMGLARRSQTPVAEEPVTPVVPVAPAPARSAMPPQGQQPAVISVNLDSATIDEVVAQFANYSGKSIIPGANITDRFNAHITNQRWDVALQAILDSHGLAAQ